jgi:hypothetical protein
MRRLPPTKKTILRQSGVVQLVRLERFDCAKEIYGVTAPQNVGHIDGLPICEQFMTEAEAVRAYDRYVKFFELRDAAARAALPSGEGKP